MGILKNRHQRGFALCGRWRGGHSLPGIERPAEESHPQPPLARPEDASARRIQRIGMGATTTRAKAPFGYRAHFFGLLDRYQSRLRPWRKLLSGQAILQR